jgi:hypothetical protein
LCLALCYTSMYKISPMTYSESLEEARAELEQLRAFRTELDSCIARLEQTVLGLAALCDEPEDAVPQGLTELCRRMFRATAQDLSPIAVRNNLERMGFELARYENPMAVIHTTINRLVERGELTTLLGINPRKTYRWTGSSPAAKEALRKAADKESAILKLLEDVRKRG